MILCPTHGVALASEASGRTYRCSSGCLFPSPAPGVIDLLPERQGDDKTSEHYSLQWGAEVDFASFYRSNPDALSVMTSKQMGWPGLIERIRALPSSKPVKLLDAACGYGGLFQDLFAPAMPEGLSYLGADIHGALATIKRPDGVDAKQARFVRWNISDPLPTDEVFDFIICRAAIHHTENPRATFRSLVSRLAPGGTIAITVYAKKPVMREASDDAIRSQMVPMPPKEAFGLARQFTLLGRDLQKSDAKIEIAQDLPFLGIKAGQHQLQEFIYDHFLKCWFNPKFGERYSDVVNFDWYHPPYAYRYEPEEVRAWFGEHNLEISQFCSTKAQHYFEGHLHSGSSRSSEGI
jgi:arsenite methyltransferase